MKKEKPENDKEQRAVLYVSRDGGSPEAIKLRRDATIFGREKGDVLIADAEVSATHCQIQNIGGNFHIFDMNSTNGTFVNDQRIVKSRLHHDDQIRIGKTVMRFALEDERRTRHISTQFKTGARGGTQGDSRSSLVDSLIESELRQTQSHYVILNVTYGDGRNEEIPVQQKQFFIGRAAHFGKFEADPEISRKHLLVKVNDTGDVFVEDQGSMNGSFVNGKKISSLQPVGSKDIIAVGSCRIRILVKSRMNGGDGET
ncbi:MAG: hypothetical protein RIQ81_1735 [Pseudomonadota bacterium]